jgi:hypothetical protein
MNILNLGAGKLSPIVDDKMIEPWCMVHVDQSYFYGDLPNVIEMNYENWKKRDDKSNLEMRCISDAFEFMERTTMLFDRVCMYRFLEHIPFDRVAYFIYLISTVTKSGGLVDVIVPNYKVLAQMIQDEYPFDKDFEANNILLTTELLNEPGCPHASIWTPIRAFYFWQLEKRFEIHQKDMFERFEFDGRHIYMRFLATRL